MAFECSQCGECCSHLGLVHIVVGTMSDDRFIVLNRYSNERSLVTLDPDKTALFADRGIFASLPEACPFFRTGPDDGLGYCCVHLTRPLICRDFGCWRILILTQAGKRAGRIMERYTFVSEDDLLRQTWDQHSGSLKGLEGDEWDEAATRLFTNAGFVVVT